jgi:hypothetical protein
MTCTDDRRIRARCSGALLGAAALLLIGCGGTTATNPSSTAPTVTMSSTGVDPVEVHIRVSGTVNFLNNDNRVHAMSSDPITVHTDCPAINQVGTLSPGQSGSTGTLLIPRTCGFHDHTNETDSRWHGRIVVE